MNQQQREQAIVNRISTVGIAGNVALTAFKLFAGVAGHSGAMISDAVHSLSDVFATLIAFWACASPAGRRTRATPTAMSAWSAWLLWRWG